ncbi:tyrosyl-tRNA synthetase [Cryomyces antarcticus]|nr:tyrosyl-tRNA synthetase [Cryomyces antarcticus]
MENGDGMSFAEFTYPVLQAWDWWYMYNTKHPAIQLQIGGSDQYGNIVAGIDAIKYITKNHSNPELRQEKEDPLMTPYGLTVPLLTTSSGEKFGKSAGNAIWLDKEMTSSFDLYGFFLRSADADVERYLKLFTFLPMETIRSVMEEHAQNPSKRTAQHLLAAELLELVHGKLAAEEAAQQHSRFSGNRSKPTTSTSPTPSSPTSETTSTSNTNTDINRSLNPHAPPTNWENAPSPNTTLPRSLVYGMTFGRILYHAGLVSSYSEGNRLIQKGGVYVGSAPAQIGHQRDEVSFTPAKWGDPAATEQFIIDGQLLILRVGKWKVKVIKIVDDDEFRRMGGSAPGWEALEEEGGKERLRKGAERDYDEARKPVKVRKWKGGNDVPGEPVRSTKRASSEIPVSGFGATHREGGRNEFKSLRGTESEDAPRRPFRASTDSTDESARIRMQASDRPVTIRKHLSEWSGSDGTKGWRNVD